MWRPSFQFGQCVGLGLFCGKLAQGGGSGSYETEGQGASASAGANVKERTSGPD
jgi:hypothetical protein